MVKAVKELESGLSANVSLAKTYYESYVLLMNSLGKTNEIAQRVLKRIQ